MTHNLPTDRTSGLATEVADLTGLLDAWASGQFDPARPGQRTAASDAVDGVDTMLKILYQLRQELVAEIRAYDDASMRRTDALLRQIRAERDERDAVLAEFDAHRRVRDAGSGAAAGEYPHHLLDQDTDGGAS